MAWTPSPRCSSHQKLNLNIIIIIIIIIIIKTLKW